MEIDPQIHGCSITVHKMVQCLHITHTHTSSYPLKPSLDYLIELSARQIGIAQDC